MKQAEALVTLLPQISRQLFSLTANDLAFELPGAQLRVVNVLREKPRTITSLRDELGISLSAVNQLVDRLETAGLVDRSVHDNDRRCKRVQLTPRALNLLSDRRERRMAHAARTLELLSVDTREEIIHALETLLDVARAITPTISDAGYSDQLA